MSSHSLFSPSSASRVETCPASLRINARLPERNSFHSCEGTMMHTVADECWPGGDPADYIGRIFTYDINGVQTPIEFEQQHADAVDEYLMRCHEIVGDHFSEQRLEHTRWTPGAEHLAPWPDLPQEVRQFGTTDHAVLRTGHGTIVDLKGGAGHTVYAKENKQLVLYALSVIDAWDWLYDFQTFDLVIVQPRKGHYDKWSTTVEELRRIGTRIKLRFIEALKPDAPFGPSAEACLFCGINGKCRAQQEAIAAESALKFDDIVEEYVPPTAELTLDELVSGYKMLPLLSARASALEAELLRRAMAGVAVPGLKVVESNTRRKFKSDDDAYTAMNQAGIAAERQYVKKPLSPAQAEKIAGKAGKPVLAPFITKPPGGPVLAPSDDPRPEYGRSHQAAFDDLVDPNQEV